MEESILNFNKQFNFEPEIQNEEYLGGFDHIILGGMGGSHLSADLIKTIKPGVDIYVYKDYDLPPFEEDFLKRALFVACSYSGNTEETLDFFQKVVDKNFSVAVISSGGKLLQLAVEKNIPYIEIPNTGIQPRQADGYLAISLLKLMGDEDTIASWSLLSEKIKPENLKNTAKQISKEIGDKIPLIYASNRNLHIAYNWKITFNETAKIPAFYNIFPELNHNEIQGFEFADRNIFHVIFLEDFDDNQRVKDRMKITKEIYEELGMSTSTVTLNEKIREEQVFNAILLVDWVALFLAEKKGIDPEKVDLIEDFKKRLSDI